MSKAIGVPHETTDETEAHQKQSVPRIFESYPEWTSWAVLCLMVAAVVVRLFYWYYTDRTWEDALITVLHSENFVRGLGLTHLQPAGEPPLHGFTSPLSVLIPLVGDLVHVGWGVSFLKLVSAFCGAVAVWLGARISQAIGLPPALAVTAAAYLAFEHHQILWGMAGMETEVVTVAYLASIYALLRGTQWQKGLSLGLVMLARPDGAFWVAIALAVELWRARQTRQWRSLIPVIAGIAVLYAPWLIFTTVYYGSPVPNTIHAKSLGYPAPWSSLHHDPHRLIWIGHHLYDTLGALGPSYGGNGTGFQSLWDHRVIFSLMAVLCLMGAVVATKRRHIEALIVFAFVVTYTFYLVFLTPIIFGWYTVPVVAGAVIGSLYGLSALAHRMNPETRNRVAVAVGVVYFAAIISVLPVTMRSDKYLQMYIESGVRKQMGIYLGRVSFPTDRIASESLGYVGYYSRRVIYDYPGLCSREVIQYLRDHPENRNKLGMMHSLRPTYIVLRPIEYQDANGKNLAPWLAQDYDLIRVFKAPQVAHEKILFLDKNIDREFDVFRLKGAPSAAQ